jgi:hypothetical protein
MATNHSEASVVVLDTRAAAEFLGVSPRTLEGLRVRGGGVPFVKIGGAVRYRLTTLEAYLQQQERVSTSDPGTAAPSPPASRSLKHRPVPPTSQRRPSRPSRRRRGRS